MEASDDSHNDSHKDSHVDWWQQFAQLRQAAPFWWSVSLAIILCSRTAALRFFALGAGFAVTLAILGFIYLLSSAQKEQNLDASKLLFDSLANGDDVKSDSSHSHVLGAESVPPPLRPAVEEFVRGIVRNYIQWWYCQPNFPTDTSFPRACEDSLFYMISSIHNSMSRKDIGEEFMKIVPSELSRLAILLPDLRMALKFATNTDPSGIERYIQEDTTTLLATLTDPKRQHKVLLRMSDDLIRVFAKQTDYNCDVIRAFLSQLLASSIFPSAIGAVATTTYINTSILEFLDPTLGSKELSPQRKAAKEAITIAAEMAREDELCFESETLARVPEATEIDLHEELVLSDSEFRGRRPRPPSALHDLEAHQSSSIDNHNRTQLPYDQSDRPMDSQDITLVPRRSWKTKKSPTRAWLSRSRSTSPKKSASMLGPSLYLASIDVTSLAADDMALMEGADKTRMFITIGPIRSESNPNPTGKMIDKSLKDVIDLDVSLQPLIKRRKRQSVQPSLDLSTTTSMRDAQRTVLKYLRAVVSDSTIADLAPMQQFCGHEDVEVRGDHDSRAQHKPTSVPLNTGRWSLGDGIIDSTKRLGASVSGSSTALAEVFKAFSSPDDSTFVLDGTSDQMGVPEFVETPSKSLFAGSEAKNMDHFSEDEEGKGLDAELSKLAGNMKEWNKNTAVPHNTSRARSQSPIKLLKLHTRSSSRKLIKDMDGSLGTVLNSPTALPLEKSPSKLSPDDCQVLVDELMKLVTAFYEMSEKTWLVRKSLLNLLRGLFLGKNSNFSSGITKWIEESFFEKVSDVDTIAKHLHKFNQFMFSDLNMQASSTDPKPTIDSEGLARRAKQILMRHAIPESLKSLMGANATNESLEIIFNALQVETFTKSLTIHILCNILGKLAESP